jgi:large subunit ribosomal protein L9
MKVILRQDVPNLGTAGEAREVSPGYFRNYLQPRGLATEATAGRMKTYQATAARISTKQSREADNARALAERLSQITLTFTVKVGDQGRMYGSVTAKDVADELKSSQGIEVDRHKIVIDESLRSAGEHTVVVKLDHGVDAPVKVELVAETSEAG